jgi:hypothetical protein
MAEAEMFEARVRLAIQNLEKPTDTRISFWRNFFVQAKIPNYPEGAAIQGERTILSKFPQILQAHLEKELRSKLPDKDIESSTPAVEASSKSPVITVKLRGFRYGSIELILAIFGLSGDSGREFLLSALEACAAISFNEAFGTNVPLTSSLPELLEFEVEGPALVTGNDKKPSIMQMSDRQWKIANTSMVIPVLIGALILFYLHTGLLHEVDGLRTERGALQTERSEIVKALVDQNTKISATIVEHAKSSVASAKAMQKLLVTLVKDKINNPGCQPPNKCPEPEKPAGPVVKQEPPSNNFNLCFISPAFADGPQRPRPRHSPGRKRNTLCPRPSPPSQPYQP